MLEQMEWIRVNKSCHALVDQTQRMLSVVYTSYDEDDKDENLVWEVEIEGEELGSYLSLYTAKLAVQRSIYEWEERQSKSSVRKKKTQTKNKKVKQIGINK